MSQLYEKKCDCKYYNDLNEHGATLLKMELPEYESSYSSSSYVICRALRFMGYITVVLLLGYSLWRIHVIESTLLASDRLHNLTRTIALESSRLHHNRVSRSVPVGHHADVNSIGSEKDLPRGSMLTAKNEFVPEKRRRPADEQEFKYLVNSLFDKIQIMHNDTDRTHLHSNMKAVFQAWFPVFDALLPEELVEDQLEPLAGSIRSVNDRVERSVNEEDDSINLNWQKIEKNFSIGKDRMNFILTHIRRLPSYADDKQYNSIEESIDKKMSEMHMEQFSDDNEEEIVKAEDDKHGKKYSKGKIHRFVRSAADKTSEESSEEKNQVITETVADQINEESSEENKPRTTRSAADKTSEESSEEKKQRIIRSVADKTSEDFSDEDLSVKHRFERLNSMNSDESKSSSEEEKRRVKYNKNNKSKGSSEEEEKKDQSKKKEKSSEESVESSESAASKEKKNKEKNELFYQVVTSDQDGSKTIVQVD